MDRTEWRDEMVRHSPIPDLPSGTEVVEKRRPNIKHYNMGGGRFQMVVYPEPIHFEENGNWIEIDNSLAEATDTSGHAVLRSKAHPLGVEFSRETADSKLVRIHMDGKELSWSFEPPKRQQRRVQRMDSAQSTPMRAMEIREAADGLPHMRTTARYDSIVPGMDVRYELRGCNFKEDIILTNKAALQHAAIYLPNSYSYQLEDDGSVRVLERDGKPTPFSFQAPYAYDGNGESLAVRAVLQPGADCTCMRYLLDEAGTLNAALPITIDPMVSTQSGLSRTTFKKGEATGTTAGRLKSGKNKNGIWATALRLNDIDWDGMNRSDTVTSAYLHLTDKTGKSANFVAAYRILQPWKDSTVNWDTLKCDGAGKAENDRLDPNMLDCMKGASSGRTIKLNITRAYRAWKNGEKNEGILLCRPHVMTKDNYMEFTDPKFYVNYISHAGMADWWQYETQSVGRAGNVNVDIFNGNLVYAHPDMQMGGNRMPIGVTHVYNSCLSARNEGCTETETNPKLTNNFHCGKGFKLSVQQCVDLREAGGSWFFVWTDATGLEHWFKKKDAKKKSDDLEGMGLKLVYYKKEGNRLEHVTITDKTHTVMTFKRRCDGAHAQWNNYWLTEIEDSIRRESGVFNRNVYNYRTAETPGDAAAMSACEGMLTSIKDGAGREVQFFYDDQLRLTQITWPGATDGDTTEIRSAYFAYDGEDRLTDIGYYDLQTADGGIQYQTKLSYNGGLLTKVENPFGKAAEISYDRDPSSNAGCGCGCPYCCNVQEDLSARVVAVEYTASTLDGIRRGARKMFEYDVLKTRVIAVENTDSDKGKALTWQFNDSGNVVSVLDELGFAQFAKFNPATPNQPESVSKLMKVVVNRLKPFSTANTWTQDQGGGAVIGYEKNANPLRILGTPTAKVPAGGSICQMVKLARGATYTASAYAYLKDPATAADGDFDGLNVRIKVQVDGKVYESLPADVEMMKQEKTAAHRGWTRMNLRFAVARGEGEASVALRLVNEGSATAYFGWPQLERGETINHVNLLDNADFREDSGGGDDEFKLPRSWSCEKEYILDADNHAFNPPEDMPKALEGRVMQISATPNQSQRKIFQTLPISGAKNAVFTFGGWAKALSLPGEDAKAPYFDLAVSFRQKSNGKYTKATYLTFNKHCREWQFACRAAIAPCDFTSVRVHAVYSCNAGKAMFTNLFLSREEFGQSFVYDDDKDVVSASDRAGEKTKVKYDSAKNIISYRKAGRSDSVKYDANYGETDAQRKEHLPRWTRTPSGVLTRYSYDRYGNAVKLRTLKSGKSGANDPCLGSATEYTADGLFATKTKDARGMAVTKEVEPKLGRVRRATDPAGTSVEYEYDASDRVTCVKCQTSEGMYENRYEYAQDQLRSVRHNTAWDAESNRPAGEVEYRFDYDALGRKSTVKVGEQLLSSNVYGEDRSGLLKEVRYGNGGKLRYEHDEYDRLTGVSYDDDREPRYKYTYDAEGRAAMVEDNCLMHRAATEYDLSGRPVRATRTRISGGDEEVYYRTRLGYGKDGNITEFCESVEDRQYRTNYNFDGDDRASAQAFQASGVRGIKYGYDGMGRLVQETRGGAAVSRSNAVSVTGNAALKTAYSYCAGDAALYGAGATTPLVEKIVHGDNALSFAYSYDRLGNILTVSQYSGSAPATPTVQYFYDALGQLIRVNDKSDLRANPLGTTWIYEYDLGGNLTQKRMYRYEPDGETPVNLVESVAYAYDANWRDKLISYDGKPIAYDEIGNPIQYNGTTYEWKAGRQLARMRMRTEVGSNGIEAEDGVDAKSGTRLHIEFTDGNMICGGITETRAIARVVQDGREISDEYSEKVFHWTRESGDAEADAAWNAAHSGMREITLTAADVPNKAVLRCSITGTADAYGAMVADATNLGLTHQKGDLDAGHTFGVEEGNLMLYIPFVEPEALPSDPEVDATEEIPALDMDNGDLSDPEVEEGGTPEEDIPETEDEGDVGDGTYIPGEEEAPDYDDPINNSPDPIYTPESAIPDEDTAKIPKGISYLLEDGELKIVMGLGDVLTAWATVYNTEPDEQLDFKYDANGLRVQKVYTTPNVTETTDYILHGKLITHLTKKHVPSSGTATTEQLHFFYDKSARPAMVEYNNTLYYYRHNLQGDIVEIVDDSGNPVVKYAYDAWGTPTNVEGTLKTTLGELNPFRYRGYVWDAESGLYYLRSRYYNPLNGRNLNSDILIQSSKRFGGTNVFAYCVNNPVRGYDPSGRRLIDALSVQLETTQLRKRAMRSYKEVGRIDSVNSYNTRTRISLSRRIDWLTTEQCAYDVTVIPNNEAAKIAHTASYGNSNLGVSIGALFIGEGLGAGADWLISSPLYCSGSALMLNIIKEFCSDVEQDQKMKFTEMAINASDAYAIAYVEKASYTYTEGLGGTPLIEDSYFIYWDGEDLYDILH